MAERTGERPVLTIGHSPDPDDAFMWWPLGDAASGRAASIDTGRFAFQPIAEDIEALNRRAAGAADLDVTALSIHNYPAVKQRYALTSCGASFGEAYGPKVVARADTLSERRSGAASLDWMCRPGVRVAIPGVRTSAYLTLRLCLGRPFTFVETPFERIIDSVVNAEADAGLVIHEGQLTFADSGLELVVDLGAWWSEQTGLPLPLGGNAIKRNLDERFGRGASHELAGTLRRSIEHAMERRREGLDHAMGFARGISRQRADKFISMYVNDLTLDAGERGLEAVRTLLERGAAAGLCESPGGIDMVRPMAEAVDGGG